MLRQSLDIRRMTRLQFPPPVSPSHADQHGPSLIVRAWSMSDRPGNADGEPNPGEKCCLLRCALTDFCGWGGCWLLLLFVIDSQLRKVLKDCRRKKGTPLKSQSHLHLRVLRKTASFAVQPESFHAESVHNNEKTKKQHAGDKF